MVLPLVVAGVGMAVGAMMQYYNSEKARGATKEQLAKIEAIFNKIVPPDIDLKIYDDPKLAANIPPTAYDFSKITPQDYQVVAKISPESADYVKEASPQLVTTSQNAETGRAAQLDALRRYKQIAMGENDPEFAQLVAEASRKARQDSQSQQASILDSLQRRGVAGGGAELAMRQNAAGADMEREAVSGQAAAANAYRNRLDALSKGASLGGDIRQSEMGEAKTNADIVNDYNQRTSKRYQDYLSAKASNVYDARIRNEENAQRVSDANTANANKFSVDNVERTNRLVGAQHSDEMQNRDYMLSLARAKAGAQQQRFANEMDIAKGKAGIANNNIDYINGAARDKNNVIQGVTNAVAGTAMAYDKNNPQQPNPTPENIYDQGYQGDGYDDGTTPGNYRRARGDDWRTA